MKDNIKLGVITAKECERFHEDLNKAAATFSINIRELGYAFGRMTRILKDDKFYEVICMANKYIEEQEKIK